MRSFYTEEKDNYNFTKKTIGIILSVYLKNL